MSSILVTIRNKFVFFIKKVLTLPRKSVKLYTDNVLGEFYRHVINGNIEELHIPHSDVFYVREAVQAHYGRPFTLKHVEDAMRAEGWSD